MEENKVVSNDQDMSGSGPITVEVEPIAAWVGLTGDSKLQAARWEALRILGPGLCELNPQAAKGFLDVLTAWMLNGSPSEAADLPAPRKLHPV